MELAMGRPLLRRRPLGSGGLTTLPISSPKTPQCPAPQTPPRSGKRPLSPSTPEPVSARLRHRFCGQTVPSVDSCCGAAPAGPGRDLLAEDLARVMDGEFAGAHEAEATRLPRACTLGRPASGGSGAAPRDLPLQPKAPSASTMKPGPAPEEIVAGLCKARTWNGGFGGQCPKRAHSDSGDFCARHGAPGGLKHGRVDGPVPQAKLLEMQRAMAAARGVAPAAAAAGGSCLRRSRNGVSECARAIPWKEVRWLSDGEEESDGQEDLEPPKKRARGARGAASVPCPSTRRHRSLSLMAPVSPAELLEAGNASGAVAPVELLLEVGDFARAIVDRTEGIGEICKLFENSGGKQMLWRRFYTGEELKRRVGGAAALAAGAALLHQRELVETEELLELPVSVLRPPRPAEAVTAPSCRRWSGLEVLSEECFHLRGKSTDGGDGGFGGAFFCRRSLALGSAGRAIAGAGASTCSGLLWEVPWNKAARAERRKACLRAFAGGMSLLPPPSAVAAVSSGMHERLTRAAAALRPDGSATGGRLFGRETEQSEIIAFLRGALRAGGRREVLYVSGMPGTGKTASALAAVRSLQDERAKGAMTFAFAHVNAMCLSSPGAVFGEICRKVPAICAATGLRRRGGGNVDGSTTLTESQAYAALARFFSGEGERESASREVVVLLLDEVDCLVTQAQAVLYRLFDWLSRPHARLVVVAIANTMDLPERLLPRVSSRLNVLRVNFAPYDRARLRGILAERLSAGGAEGVFKDDALQLCAARVASASGDARKALQVCRRAAEARLAALVAGAQEEDEKQDASGPITLDELSRAEAELLRSNPAVRIIAGLSLKARRLLLAVVLELRRRPGAQALPWHAAQRRYQGLMALCDGRALQGEGQAVEGGDDVGFVVERLAAMAVLRVQTLACSGTGDVSDRPMLELGESLDLDDAADALASHPGDEVAKELLGAGPGGHAGA
mmetsp:Transcript_74188/g.158994  ORF Transcript_74188/g.158994 Transcript_74188/m.158994 type:complete len:962 (+) Transcript_74188:87-2972(+)